MMGLGVPGLGKIFIEYATVEDAKEAKKVTNLISNSMAAPLTTKLSSAPFTMRPSTSSTISNADLF